MRFIFLGFAAMFALVSVSACVPQAGPEPEPTQSPADVLDIVQSAPTGGTCATKAGISCTVDADYCAVATGQCTVAAAIGTCTTKPQICTREYRPVCGCNGQTYGNACTAAAAGMNVAFEGECPKQPAN